ncbi:sodium/glutamate symporter [Candidatus Endobugula sertula]|uniref:Sodium/glutamate symporter n=1 Tax=Candidatus Endobugula sertula TaxID=62101 RepID=A0A1D2QNQ7_9GAMM|nr:sodium/glutamate symporter [Candidatus Endobugula sertula]
MNTFVVDDFMTYTLGILIFFVGVHLNRRVTFLRHYHIPEAVTGGLIATLGTFFIFLVIKTEVEFQMDTRDTLLIYFFTAIGINARLSDLVSGGKPLTIMLVLTLFYILLQNMVGIAGATLMGSPSAVGVLAGSASLIGGHGTTIAWAPDIAALGINNALEIGITCATLGLVIASLVGGPIAQFLLARYKLSGQAGEPLMAGIVYKKANTDTDSINHMNVMAAILVLHIVIIIGHIINQQMATMGFKFPVFVTCLLTGIVLSNSIPYFLPKLYWPARTRALAMVSEFSLGLFLTISLMSMQLWKISELAGPLLLILLLQTIAAVLFIIFVLFPLMGKNYQAVVLSAGFGGFALGATPTAIANMTAVTKSHGPSPTAFLILPLISAFFVDVANAFIIRYAIGL